MATFTTLTQPLTPCIADKPDGTGRVRGFRTDHNEACYLARRLERSV